MTNGMGKEHHDEKTKRTDKDKKGPIAKPAAKAVKKSKETKQGTSRNQ